MGKLADRNESPYRSINRSEFYRNLEVIDGPEFLVGRRFLQRDIRHGGWCNGKIVCRNVHTNEIITYNDTIEEI